MLWTIIQAVILGAILGALGRLIVPGKQSISLPITIIIGILAALIGGFIYDALGGTDDGFNFIKLLIQAAVAALGVVGYTQIAGRTNA